MLAMHIACRQHPAHIVPCYALRGSINLLMKGSGQLWRGVDDLQQVIATFECKKIGHIWCREAGGASQDQA